MDRPTYLNAENDAILRHYSGNERITVMTWPADVNPNADIVHPLFFTSIPLIFERDLSQINPNEKLSIRFSEMYKIIIK